MKTAEEWEKDLKYCDQEFQLETIDIVNVIKQIQLDAWKQGMEDALMIAKNPLIHIPQEERSFSYTINILNGIEFFKERKLREGQV